MRLSHPPVSLVLPQPVRCSPAPPVHSAWPRPTPSARRNVRRASCIRASASSSDDPDLPHYHIPHHRRPTTCTHRQLSTAPGGNSDPPAGAPSPPRFLARDVSFSSLAEQLPTGAGHAGGAGRRARARSWRNARRSSFGCGIRWGSSAMGGRLIRVYVLTRTRGATPAHIIGGHVDRRNK